MTWDGMLEFKRDHWSIEVHIDTWGEIMRFLAKTGWTSSQLTSGLADGRRVTEDVATQFSTVGQIVLDEVNIDPFGALAAMQFDWGVFAELVVFTSEGEFVIRKLPE